MAQGPLVRRAAVVVLLLAAVAGCSKKKALTSNLNLENKVELRSVNLYFESPDMLLVPERRDVPLPENPAGAIPMVVRELFKGSANPAVPRLFPADIVLRGAYLLPDGTVFVDVGGQTLTDGWNTGSHQELMAIESLVQTLVANFEGAHRVRILVNGSPAETLGGHVSLSRSLGPMPSLVSTR
jgi:spore germination protein GerM